MPTTTPTATSIGTRPALHLQPLELANLRADLEDSDLPWRVDLCVWDDLPAWLQTLIAQHGCPLEPSQG